MEEILVYEKIIPLSKIEELIAEKEERGGSADNNMRGLAKELVKNLKRCEVLIIKCKGLLRTLE